MSTKKQVSPISVNNCTFNAEAAQPDPGITNAIEALALAAKANADALSKIAEMYSVIRNGHMENAIRITSNS